MSINFRLAGVGIVCALLTFSTAVAQNADPAPKFYLDVNGGPAWQGDLRVKEGYLFAPTPNAKVKFDPGARIRIGVGYQITDPLAVEVETGFSYNQTRSVGGDTSEAANFEMFQVPVLANLIYRIPTRCRIKPFIGAGAGGVLTRVDQPNGYALFFGSGDDDFVFGYQGFAGLRFEINRSWAVGLQYNFLGTLDHTFERNLHATTTGTGTHSLTAGFSFKF